MSLKNKVKESVNNRLTSSLIKVVASRLVPELYHELISQNCDFAVIDLMLETYSIGDSVTGEIKKTIVIENFKKINNFSFAGFSVDSETAKNVLSSIRVLIKNENIYIFAKSEIVGNVNLIYPITWAIKKK